MISRGEVRRGVYLPIAGGVWTIESSRQITTKIARPVATIIQMPSSADIGEQSEGL